MKSISKLTVWKKPLLPFAAVLILTGTGTADAVDYPSTILADNPSAYYRLEELPGATTAVDSSVNGVGAAYYYNIENNSPGLGLPGIDTNSIAYNGGGSSGDFGFIDIPASSLVAPLAPNNTDSAAFSEEMWVKVPSQPVTWQVPVEVAQYPNGWNVYVSGADAGNGAASYFYLVMRPNLFTGVAQIQFLQWNHIVVTFDGTNATMYVNGVAYGPYSAAGFVPAIGSDVHIGSGQGVGWQPLNGGVDEVAFYTNVLTAAQVLNHYQVGTNSFRAPPTPPSILVGPASTTNYSGLPVSFTVSADGTLPLNYQWLKNSAPIGPNSSLLSFNCQYPADDGASIQVVITNNYGSITSAVATLSVLTNENIPGAPGSILRNVGSYAAFHVTAYGAVPITYQWSQSTDGGGTFTPISGASSSTLWLTNVQLSQDGYQYAVSVNGPFSTSSVPAATLNVQARPVNVPLSGYGSIIAADKPVAYWRLDEADGSGTAVDAAGSFDGAYTPNLGTVTYGLPPGIPNDTNAAVGITSGATIRVPFAPELNPDTPWSVETWVQPTIIGGDYRVVLSSEYNSYPNPYNGWYIYQQPNGTFAFVPQPGNVFLSAGSLVVSNWYYLVITDDGTNFNMYINGVLAVAPLPVASANYIPNGNGVNADGTAGITPDLGATVLGQRTDGAFSTFQGTIDDTAIYKYALTPQQVMLHYINKTYITVTPLGTGKVALNWPVGVLQQSTNVAGPYVNVVGTTGTFYTNSIGAAKMFYRVNVP